MKAQHALSGLFKFLHREKWALRFQEVLASHVTPILEEYGLEYEDISDTLGDYEATILWGCAFEDFLTQRFDPEKLTFVEDYLKHHQRKENASSQTYMKALSASVMSLYEVSEIIPGKSFLARDLLRNKPPAQVSEISATQTLRQWAWIGARIVPLGDTHVLSGGTLPFSREASDQLLQNLNIFSGMTGSIRTQPVFSDEVLRMTAPLFSHIWLSERLSWTFDEKTLPMLFNGDNEEVVFHEVCFPLASGITQKDIAARLQTIPELQQENTRFWNWLNLRPTKRAAKKRTPGALMFDTLMDNGASVMGQLELKGRFLILSVNSSVRATKGVTWLNSLLGKMIRDPLTTIQTVEQLMASQRKALPPGEEIPLEIAAPLVHATLDQYYRATLDQPIEMLGNITPRAAVQTKTGQQKVAEWLKYLEHNAACADNPQDPMATYD